MFVFFECLTRFQVNDSTRVATSCRALQNSFRMQLSQALFLGKPWENRDSMRQLHRLQMPVLSCFIQFLDAFGTSTTCIKLSSFHIFPTSSDMIPRQVAANPSSVAELGASCLPHLVVQFLPMLDLHWMSENNGKRATSMQLPASPQHLSASMGVRFRLPE